MNKFKWRSLFSRSMQWQRLGIGSITNITDSYKYGIWDALPGWGMQEGEHVSLMRIRDVNVEDLATYRCDVMCMDRRGRLQHQYYYADVCLTSHNAQSSELMII